MISINTSLNIYIFIFVMNARPKWNSERLTTRDNIV